MHGGSGAPGPRAARLWLIGKVVVALGIVAGTVLLARGWVRTDDELDRRTATLEATREELAATQSSLDRREQELSDSRREVAVQEDALAAQQEQLDQRTATLRRVLSDLVAVRGSLAETVASLDLTTADRDRLAGELQQTAARLGSVQSSLDAATSTITLQGAAIATLQRCLAGVTRALNSAAIGDTLKAIESLEAVRKDCADADAIAGGGGPQPVYPFDFADPFLLDAGGTYYAFATEAAGGDIQVITSKNLTSWTAVGHVALATAPSWAGDGPIWAPAVLRRGDGRYVLYYSVTLPLSLEHCVSAAVADTPAGPYRDDSTEAVICHSEKGGAIDPDTYVAADGTPYLLWKSDGQGQAAIHAQQLAPDG
ncbi:MAG TPA: family 43 glycosylhydrolase, partial [Acidimicrobiales bacterium]